MNKQTITPIAKQKLKGVALVKALLERQKFIGNHLANGGTVSELENMGYKYGTLYVRNLTKGNIDKDKIVEINHQ